MKQFLLLMTLFASSFSFAQQTLIPFQQGKKWGYINKSGETVIEPQYKNAEPFCEEGLALVYDFKGRKWLFIDPDNNPVKMPFENFEVKKFFGFGTLGFKGGFVKVVYKDKLALINTEGELVYPAKYEKISNFYDGIAIGKLGTTWYLMDKEGEKIAIQTKAIEVDLLKNGYAPFRISSKKWGFVDASGAVVIKAQFKTVGYFYNGIAWARTMEGKIGYINPAGEWLVEPKYDAATDFDNDSKIARVRIEDNWMFIRASGETFDVSNADKLGEFHDGLAWAKSGDLTGYVNTKGEWVIEPTYTKANNFNDGAAFVRKGDFWGMIDKNGKFILEAKYTKIGDLRDGFVFMREGDAVGVASYAGDIILKPTYQAIKDYYGGYALVKQDNKWGVIDTEGNLVVQPEYLKLKRATTIK